MSIRFLCLKTGHNCYGSDSAPGQGFNYLYQHQLYHSHQHCF